MRGARDPALALAEEAGRAARRPGAARTLLLDLDGTLAPLAPTPEAVRVPRSALGSLRRLVAQGWTVAIVSGRPAADVRRLVPVAGILVFGSHGLEGGVRPSLPSALRTRLARLAEAAGELSRRFPGARVEAKPAGIAFHDRQVPRRRLAGWRQAVRRLLSRQDLRGLDLLRGKRVVEIRPEGWHKGRVLERLPGLPPPGRRPDPSFIAVGDDRTDEDLFEAVRRFGVAARVGRPRRGTSASRRLASPAAVGRFLERLARIAQGASGNPRRPGLDSVPRSRV